VYRHGLRLLLDKNIPAWVDLWDDDGVCEFPFAPEGWPRRLEGKAAVGDYMHGYPYWNPLAVIREPAIDFTSDVTSDVTSGR
jgi:ketosteroid isomerase-like protein